LAAVPIASAPACGCGVMIPSDPSEREGQRVDEWSVVRWDGQREDLTMRLESSTAFDRAALIMPLPSRARFALGHDAVFDGMTERTKPRVVKKTRHVLFGGGSLGGGSEDEGAGPAAEGGVEVVDAQDLGPLRVVTLRGDDAAIVGTWLSDHGFETPEGLEPIAQEYLDQDWLLVAVRLNGRGGQEVSKLQPLIMSFDSDQVVYPLRMSELASGPTEARVDVIAPTPLAVRGWPARDLEEPTTQGSGRLYGGRFAEGRYLTSYRFAIERDGFRDPEFVATERRDFRQTIYEYEEVDITGRVLGIGFGVLAALGLLAVWFVRRRRRAA
jgi:hypothetical protein